MSPEDLDATLLDSPDAEAQPESGGADRAHGPESTLLASQSLSGSPGPVNPVTQVYRPAIAPAKGAAEPPAAMRVRNKSKLQAGTVLDGRYRLDRIIGAGAMGEVWSAHHLGLDAPVAVKLIANEVESSAGVDRFYREARIMARLSHPNVVRVLDVSLPDATMPYIAMELLEGESLRDRMRSDSPFSLDLARDLLAEMLAALAVAHQNGIVHRDLKPANIFLVNDASSPSGVHVKVLDFGTALLIDHSADRLTKEGIIIGTPYYMAPEQALGKLPTASCDLYAAAVIFYELLSGHVPHEVDDFRALLTRRSSQEAAPIRSLVPQLPASYDPFFKRALALEASDRHANAIDMRLALSQLPRQDGTILSFDNDAFTAALDSALVKGQTSTGAHPRSQVSTPAVTTQPAREVPSFGLDEAVPAPPKLFGGEQQVATALNELDLPTLAGESADGAGDKLSLNIDDLPDGDLKTVLKAREASDATTDAATDTKPRADAATRHFLTLTLACVAGFAMWVVGGGDPALHAFKTIPALLAGLTTVVVFVAITVARAPVKAPATSAQGRGDDDDELSDR